ncbi:unnamed protein product [Parnassius apollo]|uniref:(apollo) hypothetical protein n=1 Tax=Parnassius apollo TaxID=110799 RepID=A0A8S3W1U4_PARAO|nr:unnamed protein product [Parnassius apollo]
MKIVTDRWMLYSKTTVLLIKQYGNEISHYNLIVTYIISADDNCEAKIKGFSLKRHHEIIEEYPLTPLLIINLPETPQLLMKTSSNPAAVNLDGVDLTNLQQLNHILTSDSVKMEKRDVLWDKTLESYKDKRKTLQAWRDICTLINEDFETLLDVEKNKYGKLVVKKLKSMRDERKLSESKSGSGANPIVHKYTYYDNIKFLSKIAQHRDTESNMQPTFNTESDDSHDTLIRKRKKEQVHKEKDLSVVDRRMIQFIDSMQKEEKKTDDSRIMSFFKSIAPTIEKFSDDEVVEFQYQVISILRNFKQRNISSNISESQSIHLQESIQLQPTYDIEAYGYSTAPGPSNVRSQSRLTTYSSELEFDSYTRFGQSQPSVQSSMSDDLDFATLNN